MKSRKYFLEIKNGDALLKSDGSGDEKETNFSSAFITIPIQHVSFISKKTRTSFTMAKIKIIDINKKRNGRKDDP